MPEWEFCTTWHGVPRERNPWDRKLAALDCASIVESIKGHRVSRGS